jgi:undecaprenyl-diphosphatase
MKSPAADGREAPIEAKERGRNDRPAAAPDRFLEAGSGGGRGRGGARGMNVRTRILALVRKHHPDSFVLVLFLIIAAALFAFLKLASEVAEGDTEAFDRWVLQALRGAADPTAPIGPDWLRRTMVDLTALGGTPVLTLIVIVVAAYLVAARKVATAAFVVAAVSGGGLASTLLKLVFARTRPDIVGQLVEVHSASFPSGHALNSAVTYLTLGALLARTESARWMRIYVMAVAMSLTLMIGCSRVYLGVHWPSDVIAGWCFGAAWALLCSLAARALQRRRAIEPEG